MWTALGLWLIVLVPLTMGVIVGVSAQYEAMPAWFHKMAFIFRTIFKIAVYVALVAFALLYVLPSVVIWIFPNSAFGYAMKYNIPAKSVFVQPKPHDCEWGKAPIGNKYCHFDSVVDTALDQSGKINNVYVSWQKVEE